MSLIHWWPLNGDCRDQGTKSTTSILLSNSSFAEGKTGKSLDYVSDSCGIDVTCNLVDELQEDYSAACWIYINGTHTHYNGTFISSGNWNKDCWAFGINQSNTAIDPFGPWYNKFIEYPGGFKTNTWYHIVTSCKNNVASVYVNGKYIGYKNFSKKISSDANNLTIGRETYAGGYFRFKGKICDMRIYNHALSLKEIHELSKGLFAHYTFQDPTLESTTNLIANNNFSNWSSYGFGSLGKGSETQESFPALLGQVYKITSSDTTTAIKNVEWARWVTTNLSLNKYVTFSIYVKGNNSSFGCNAFAHIYNSDGTNTISRSGKSIKLNNEWQRVEYTMIWPYDTTSASSSIYVVAQIPGGASYYISNPQVEFTKHATLYSSSSRVGECTDSSGFGNTLVNGPHPIYSDNNTPLYQKSILFNNDFQQHWSCPAFKFIKQDITMSCWFKCNGEGAANYQFIMSQGRDCGNAGINIQLDKSGTVCYCRYKTLSMSDYSLINMGNVQLNKWYHAVVTYNGKQIKTYINGVSNSPINVTGDLDWGQCSDRFVIGKMAFAYSNTGSYFAFNGSVSDVRVYATALSDSDILKLYQSKASIDRNGNYYTGMLEEKNKNFAWKTTYQMSDPAYKPAGFFNLWSSYDTIKVRSGNGVYFYQQEYNHGSFTKQGARIYSPPNIIYSEVGNKMWGGFSFQPFDVNKDYIQEGHTYIITWHMKGQTSRGTSYGWTNYFGWGGGGMSPRPYDVELNAPKGTFNGEQDCYYRFTADSPWKECTDQYSSFELGKVYPSYGFFTIGYGYADTGPLGTDIYISNFQMFDITDMVNKNPNISTKSILSSIQFVEKTNSNVQLFKSGLIQANSFNETL